MGCLLRCFGFQDSCRKSLLFSRFFWSEKREPVVPKNQYSSLASSKEKSTPSKKTEEEIFNERFYGDDFVLQEQRQEAKLRKTYGAILDNHSEFRKASDQQHLVSDAFKKNWVQNVDDSSHLSLTAHGTSAVSEEKSKSCQLEDHDDKSRKSLLFEEVKHPRVKKELESVTLDMSPQIENQMQPHCGDSPHPTPLNLLDGMQTPATIYPPKSENFRTRMLRTQFVYPIPDQSTFELIVDGEGTENTEKIYDSPDVHRSIIGSIASHWDKEAPTCVSTKSFDGNEIPYSNTNNNEDLKHSWHATPFSLSDEKVLPQRKLDGKINLIQKMMTEEKLAACSIHGLNC